MVDPDLVASKLSDLADHLQRVRIRRKATAEGLAGDRDALDLVAFNLMLAVQTCADIASHLSPTRAGRRQRLSGSRSSASGTRASSLRGCAPPSPGQWGYATWSRTATRACGRR